MSRFLKSALVLLLFAGLIGWVAGPGRQPVYALRLLWAEAPATLPVPVAGVRSRDLRDSWGAPRSGGRRHQGIDIFAPKGTAVLSATPGLVWSVGNNRLGGKVVSVLGPGGEWHYYAHLDRYSGVVAGDVVAAGAVLGYVGNTGNARTTPAHLHYGIHGLRGARNPFPRLVKPLP